MKRRGLITLVGGGAAWPLCAQAQQPATPVTGGGQGYDSLPPFRTQLSISCMRPPRDIDSEDFRA